MLSSYYPRLYFTCPVTQAVCIYHMHKYLQIKHLSALLILKMINLRVKLHSLALYTLEPEISLVQENWIGDFHISLH